MKRAISLWACLTLIVTSQTLATTIDTSHSGTVVTPNKVEAKKPSRANLAKIPDASLNLDIIDEGNMLEVKLKGIATEELDWVLYQPNVGIVSRISTESTIDQIMISTLQPGDYVLMIKDQSGRALFETFTKK